MGLLDGKKAAIFGVANETQHRLGDLGGVSRRGRGTGVYLRREILEKRVRPLAEGIGSKIILPCDVTKDEEIEKFSRRSNKSGADSIFWCTPSPSPTKKTCPILTRKPVGLASTSRWT